MQSIRQRLIGQIQTTVLRRCKWLPSSTQCTLPLFHLRFQTARARRIEENRAIGHRMLSSPAPEKEPQGVKESSGQSRDGGGFSKDVGGMLLFGAILGVMLLQEVRERLRWSRTEISSESLAALRDFTASTLHTDASNLLGRAPQKGSHAQEARIAANDLLKELRDLFMAYTANNPKLPQYIWERKVTFGGDIAFKDGNSSSHFQATQLADALFTGADEDMDDALTFEDFARLVVTLASAMQGGAHAQETLVLLLLESPSLPQAQLSDLADRYCPSPSDAASVCSQPSSLEARQVLWRRCLLPAAEQGLRGLHPALAAVRKATARLGRGEYYGQTEKGKAEEEERERRRQAREERDAARQRGL